jgi:3-(3-hydroxy-phenyl)propionate hydroxylase
LIEINALKESSCSIKDLNTNKINCYEYKYLIGADGANSKVRDLKEIKQEDLNYDRNWIIIDIELITEKELGEFAIQICDPKRIGTYIPTHSPFKRWEFEIHDNDDVDEFSSDENIHKLISPWLRPEEYKILRKAIYQFHSVIAEEFQKDNCFLIGDAAHQNPPFMGEGMMTGCRDAENLAWKIIMDFTHNLDDSLLRNYQIERKAHAKFIVENSLGIGLLMEAYAHTKNKDDVPPELVAKGYGSFIIPPLDKGIFFKGKSNAESMSGQLFPQPVKISNGDVTERCDYLLGDYFSVISRKEIILSDDERKFLASIDTKILVLDSEMVDSNMWMSTMIDENKIYIVRPDKYIFGSTSEKISLSNLIEDLKIRIGFNN